LRNFTILFFKKGAFTELRYYASNFDTFKKTVLLIFLFIDGADAIYLVLFSQKFKVKLLFRATGFANKICLLNKTKWCPNNSSPKLYFHRLNGNQQHPKSISKQVYFNAMLINLLISAARSRIIEIT